MLSLKTTARHRCRKMLHNNSICQLKIFVVINVLIPAVVFPSKVEESDLTTESLECSSSKRSLAHMNELFNSSASGIDFTCSKSNSDFPPVAVRYVGDLPPRNACEHKATPCPPTIFVFDTDRGEFEKYRSEVAARAEVPFFTGSEAVNRRYRRIFARCDAWLAKSTQFYGQPPDSQPASVAEECEIQSSTSSAVAADDSVSQVAAKKAIGVEAAHGEMSFFVKLVVHNLNWLCFDCCPSFSCSSIINSHACIT